VDRFSRSPGGRGRRRDVPWARGERRRSTGATRWGSRAGRRSARLHPESRRHSSRGERLRRRRIHRAREAPRIGRTTGWGSGIQCRCERTRGKLGVASVRDKRDEQEHWRGFAIRTSGVEPRSGAIATAPYLLDVKRLARLPQPTSPRQPPSVPSPLGGRSGARIDFRSNGSSRTPCPLFRIEPSATSRS
jgi:hypothetical protein